MGPDVNKRWHSRERHGAGEQEGRKKREKSPEQVWIGQEKRQAESPQKMEEMRWDEKERRVQKDEMGGQSSRDSGDKKWAQVQKELLMNLSLK